MSETPDEIKDHIRHTREDLSANLSELEHKVKSAADWRRYFDRSPGMFLAAALGTGLLLALATNRRRPLAPAATILDSLPSAADRSVGKRQETFGEIKSALIGLAAGHAKTVLAQVLPGLQAQLANRQKAKSRPQPDSGPRNPPEGEETFRAKGAVN